nr:uncharacterized protein encoded by LINC01619 isoform X2 [Symphalangus syndactylus]
MNVCCSSHPVYEKFRKPSSRKWSSKVWPMDEFDLQTACYWFMTRCQKEAGKFGTHRGKPMCFVRSLLTVQLLPRTFPANSFVISFFPSLIYPLQVYQLHFESSDKQRAMQLSRKDDYVYALSCLFPSLTQRRHREKVSSAWVNWRL